MSKSIPLLRLSPACLKTTLPAFIALVYMFSPQTLSAQTVIGGDLPDSSAILDLQSTDKGLLIPRMSETQRNAIAGPAMGLIVLNTTNNCLEINLGTPASPDWTAVKCRIGTLSAISCSSAVLNGNLEPGEAASGVSVKVPYTGGNGGTHSGQTATSTGVTGLTATLAPGSFATGVDSLTYSLSGTPSSAGTASFALSIGGQSCTLELSVVAPTPSCWAKVSATDTLFFMCHNLASANTSADPFTPSWEINGGYWQWGLKGPDASQWLNTNTPEFAHGPTGPGAGEANEAVISGWNQTYAPSGAWTDNAKTANDPCPAGYRVPTQAQWDGVRFNNVITNVGTNWTEGATNYTTGKSYGTALMLPAAGHRSTIGQQSYRGSRGYYWSSKELSTTVAYGLSFQDNAASAGSFFHINGLSVRCAADPAAAAGSLGSLNCSNAAQTGTLTAGTAASGVSLKVPYTGGNGGTHSGQTATSTGVTGLTATLAAGNFATGADSLSYTLSGTPAAVGTASFALSIGGQSCTLELTVALSGVVGALNCGAAVQTGRLMPAQAAAGVSVSVPYTGGNGGVHNGQVIASAGVTGLTATLVAGNFGVGAGTLTYTVSGTPTAAGQASFALTIGGQSCTLLVPVGCGAYLAPGQWKVFMCHNLASANTAADPFAPSWEINGGYWQWGRKGPDASQWLNTNTPEFAHGPTGAGAGEANAAAISGWNQTLAPNGAWTDNTKTANDPCPTGYRVPTKAQWGAVLANNTGSAVGTNWTDSATNYSTGRSFGPALMLPAAGHRSRSFGGALYGRGSNGYYWSSTEYGTDAAWYLSFLSGSANTSSSNRRNGFSVRCAAE